ncbi:CPBP family intramembrane glutamic endopeptidase [Roseofilum casamattae]|uniref:Type II CAAX endopeptidase family protein n=1 Tax=Roseofilum casamattae BLCC-M143 TaxID=3022442 RepID=A0ABT7BQV2_9CYAN|nr:type II CAAX endopeptidase family protein [Roseofilum casamattae]MDJ1181574.1 type II CAAX endopeptidase family protein [Roseofilum casamattae BLCC-M143]
MNEHSTQPQKQPASIKQVGLLFLTAIAISLISLFLYNSWSQPQFQGQLQLYETNLLLNASTWDGKNLDVKTQDVLQQILLGGEPLTNAVEQYEKGRDDTAELLQTTREQLKELNQQPTPSLTQTQPLEQKITTLEDALEGIELKLGLLQTQVRKAPEAVELWTKIARESESSYSDVAEILIGLWQAPPDVAPNAEEILPAKLSGWFRYQTLKQLYTTQNEELALNQIEIAQQELASSAIGKLAIVAGIQSIGILTGIILLVFAAIQWLIKRQQSLLSSTSDQLPKVPWDWQTILLVLVAGFFFIGQLITPVIFQQGLSLFSLSRGAGGVRADAVIILLSYLISSASALGVLYIATKPFRPLPSGWLKFQINWQSMAWGIGGFAVAIPLVLLISLLNQMVWQGQGGSNPILPLALQSNDAIAIACFTFTASVAAPVFEEIIFRGFLLPSLNRYVPLWAAILLSGLAFAIAHLSLSEVIPLMTLGIIMGFIYTRSGNLLAPILLHSLWNANTLLSLFVLAT